MHSCIVADIPVVNFCPPLQSPANGLVVQLGSDTGSVARYSCDEGYTLDGNAVRVCQSSGEWSGTDPTCESKLHVCKSPVNHQFHSMYTS